MIKPFTVAKDISVSKNFTPVIIKCNKDPRAPAENKHRTRVGVFLKSTFCLCQTIRYGFRSGLDTFIIMQGTKDFFGYAGIAISYRHFEPLRKGWWLVASSRNLQKGYRGNLLCLCRKAINEGKGITMKKNNKVYISKI